MAAPAPDLGLENKEEDQQKAETFQNGMVYDPNEQSVTADVETVDEYNNAMAGHLPSSLFQKVDRVGYRMSPNSFMLRPPTFEYIHRYSPATKMSSWKSNMNGKKKTYDEESLAVYNHLTTDFFKNKSLERSVPVMDSTIVPYHKANTQSNNYCLYALEKAMESPVSQKESSLKDKALQEYEEVMDMTCSHSSY
jgi:hypothetical protein